MRTALMGTVGAAAGCGGACSLARDAAGSPAPAACFGRLWPQAPSSGCCRESSSDASGFCGGGASVPGHVSASAACALSRGDGAASGLTEPRGGCPTCCLLTATGGGGPGMAAPAGSSSLLTTRGLCPCCSCSCCGFCGRAGCCGGCGDSGGVGLKSSDSRATVSVGSAGRPSLLGRGPSRSCSTLRSARHTIQLNPRLDSRVLIQSSD